MNLSDLQAALDHHGIRPDTYSLKGGSPDERLCIERSAGGWAVYYSERGLRTGERWFATESDACEYMLQLLLDDPTNRKV